MKTKEYKKGFIKANFKENIDLQLYMLFYGGGKESLACFVKEKYPKGMTIEKGEKITQEEMISLIFEMTEEGTFFEKDRSKEEILRLHPKSLLSIKDTDWTPELITPVMVHRPEMFVPYCKDHPEFQPILLSHVKYLSKETRSFFLNLTEEDLTEVLQNNPALLKELPEDKYTKKIVYDYLQKMVKDNRSEIIDYQCKIPEQFRDKIFYQAYCMVDGYNYCKIPEEMKDTVIGWKLIHYSIEHQKSYIGFYHMMSALPKKFLTEEICQILCMKHFCCIEFVPEKFKTEEFFQVLIDNGQYSCFDPKMTDKQIISCLEHNGKMSLNHEVSIINKFRSKELDIAIARYETRACEKIPSKRWNEELAAAHMENHGYNIDKIPKQLITEDLCVMAYKGHPYATMRYIPDEFKTDSFYRRIVEETNFYPCDVPEKYLTEDLIIDYLERNTYSSMDYIPKAFHTERVLKRYSELHITRYVYPEESYTRQAMQECCYDREKIVVFKKCMVQPKDICMELIQKAASAIDSIHEPTREMWNLSIKYFPENILKAPDWYFEEVPEIADHEDEDFGENVEISQEEISQEEISQEEIPQEVKKIPKLKRNKKAEPGAEWGEQLSIFDAFDF